MDITTKIEKYLQTEGRSPLYSEQERRIKASKGNTFEYNGEKYEVVGYKASKYPVQATKVDDKSKKKKKFEFTLKTAGIKK